ncbi:MAG: hypothetical protein U1E65_21865 [Myxococcota bacterium]
MRVRWSEHEARGVLSAWRKSGLSLERFAKDRGLVPMRLRRWLKKLEGQPSSKTAIALLPVELSPAKRGEPVAVYLRSGHVIKVGRGFDEDAFKRAVALLEGA